MFKCGFWVSVCYDWNLKVWDLKFGDFFKNCGNSDFKTSSLVNVYIRILNFELPKSICSNPI